jgi:hypothetical protein
MANRKTPESVLEPAEGVASRHFEELIAASVAPLTGGQPGQPITGIVVGTLVGFTDNGMTPLVTFRGQPGSAALPARTLVDLHSVHIGRDALLLFDSGEPHRPIIVGCVRPATAPAAEVPGRIVVDADGERLIVSAAHGLVLRCGKASITLTPDGKIVTRGTHIVSHATGLNRIRGGSVQVN